MGSRHADSNRTDRATRTSSTRGPGQGRPRRRTDRVEVEIRGKRLSVRTDHDPQRVHEMADYLDEKVRQLQAMAPSAPFDKLLMLASLTVVEELFEASEDASPRCARRSPRAPSR